MVLGVFMTLTGIYREHKEYVLAKTKRRCKALAEDDAIPRGGIKELAVTCGIVSMFRASAGVVPWTGAKLDDNGSSPYKGENVRMRYTTAYCR